MNHFFRPALLTFLLLWTATISTQAQKTTSAQHQERFDRIENAKIAYLTEKLVLTPEQAQKFWPLYTEFNNKRRELGRQQRQLRPEKLQSLSDEQTSDLLQKMFALRQSEVTLEKNYFEKFQKVLSGKQLGQLFVGEREFTRVILRKLDPARPAPPRD